MERSEKGEIFARTVREIAFAKSDKKKLKVSRTFVLFANFCSFRELLFF